MRLLNTFDYQQLSYTLCQNFGHFSKNQPSRKIFSSVWTFFRNTIKLPTISIAYVTYVCLYASRDTDGSFMKQTSLTYGKSIHPRSMFHLGVWGFQISWLQRGAQVSSTILELHRMSCFEVSAPGFRCFQLYVSPRLTGRC